MMENNVTSRQKFLSVLSFFFLVCPTRLSIFGLVSVRDFMSIVLLSEIFKKKVIEKIEVKRLTKFEISIDGNSIVKSMMT